MFLACLKVAVDYGILVLIKQNNDKSIFEKWILIYSNILNVSIKLCQLKAIFVTGIDWNEWHIWQINLSIFICLTEVFLEKRKSLQ